MNKAVFLDRDGTIVVDKGYLAEADGLELLPGASEALRALAGAGFLLVVVSNQGGLALGYFTRGDLDAMDARLRSMLSQHGVSLAGTYYCIDLPDSGCDCRKPETGMVDQAIEDFRIDPARSWVVGDKTSDVQLGRNIGARTVLVMTGKAGSDARFDVEPDHTAKDLLGASRLILAEAPST